MSKDKLIADILSKLDGANVSRELLMKFRESLDTTLNEYSVEYTGTAVVPYTAVPESVVAYLVSRKVEGLSQRTLTSYKNILFRFFREIGRSFSDIDANVVRLWLYRIKENSGISDRTLPHYLTILKTFFKWAHDNDYIGKNPVTRIPSIKYDRIQEHALSAEELQDVREACADVRERTLVEVLYSTGCRVGELVSIKVSDIDMANRIIRAYNWKSKREKSVFISDSCYYWLKRYLPTLSSNVLFPRTRGKRNTGIGVGNVERIIRNIGIRAGMDDGRLHPHIFRHTLATNIVSNGGSLADAQVVLDHVKPETTLIYAELNTSQLKETHRRCTV